MPGIFFSSHDDDTQDIYVVDETDPNDIGLKYYIFEVHKCIKLYNANQKVYETDEIIYISCYYESLNRMAFFATYVLNTIFENINTNLNVYLSVTITFSNVFKYVKPFMEIQNCDDDFTSCVDMNLINSMNTTAQTLHSIYIYV